MLWTPALFEWLVTTGRVARPACARDCAGGRVGAVLSLWGRQPRVAVAQPELTPTTPHRSPSGYIGEFEVVDDHRSGKIVIDLIGRINKCGVISPRFDISVDDIEQWVVNLLPARQFGHIILTTSYGIMDHEEAKRKHTGGKVLGFFY